MKTRHEHIAEIAYFLWLNRGKPAGKDLEIWYEAEQIYNITSSGFKSKDVSKANIKTKKTTEKKASIKKAATKAKTTVKAEKKEAKNKIKKESKKDATVEAKKTSIRVSLKPIEQKTADKKPAKKVAVAKIIPILKPKVALSRGITPKSIKVIVKSKK